MLLSTDSGLSFELLAGCATLGAAQRALHMDGPVPVTTTARLRVVAHDAQRRLRLRPIADKFLDRRRTRAHGHAGQRTGSRCRSWRHVRHVRHRRNLGNSGAANSKVRYYVSTDSTKSAGDVRLGGTRAVPLLGPGAQSQGTVSVSVPSTVPAGAYTVFACADDLLAVAEADDANNCSAAPVPLQVALPDLIATGVSGIPVAVAPGAIVPVGVTVQNQGATGAGASTTRFYLSLDTSKSAGDVLLSPAKAISPLAAGMDVSPTTNVTVPTPMTVGTYYMLACADDTLNVAESQETNNCAASAGTTVIARPDLVTTAVGTPPAAAAPGTGFSVTASVRNSSPVTAGASKLRFYLSTDIVKSGNDLLMTGAKSIAALGPGASVNVNAAVTVPASASPATFYLLACADDEMKVAESDESNCLAAATTVSITRPDLLLTAVGNPPATAAPGLSFTVTETVHNNSSQVGAPSSSGRYYLSLDTVKDASDVVMTGTVSAPAIASGASSNATRTLTPPVTTALGTYRLIGCADDPGKVAELDETNNCRVATNSMVVTWPDLVTTVVSTTLAYAMPGQTFSLSDTVVNQGGHPAASSTTRYYLSLDMVRDGSDILMTATRTVGVLSVGQSSTGTKTLTIPSATPLNRYVVLACADDLNKLGELDQRQQLFPRRATSSSDRRTRGQSRTPATMPMSSPA